MQSYSYPNTLLLRESTTVFPTVLVLSRSLNGIQHFSQSPGSPNCMIMWSNYGHTINSSTPKRWLWEELRDLQWNCRELHSNVCCEGKEEREKGSNFIYFENFWKITPPDFAGLDGDLELANFWGVLRGLFYSVTVSSGAWFKKWPMWSVQGCRWTAKPESNPLGHLFIPRTLTYFSSISWYSHKASLKFHESIWMIYLFFEDREEPRCVGKGSRLGARTRKYAFTPRIRVCRCYWTLWQQLYSPCFLPT